MSSASEITRKAKSNLAFALQILPKDRRDDMTVFYAFCRTVDDTADDVSVPKTARRAALEKWEEGLRKGFPEGDAFGAELAEMMARRGIRARRVHPPARAPRAARMADERAALHETER